MINSNFRNVLYGRFIGNIGDSIYYIILSWYILQLTNDSFWVGILNASFFLPNIFSFALGDLIDNTSKRKMLIILEIGQFVSILLIVIIMVLNLDIPWLYCIAAFIASLFGMNTYTVQDAFIPKIVEKKDLEKAQSLMSMSYKIADYLFNGIIGFLMEYVKYVYLLIASAISFLFSAFSFSKIDNTEEEIVKKKKPVKEYKDFLYGFKYIFKNKSLTIFTIYDLITNFMFSGLSIYIIMIADKMKSSFLLGILNSSISIGAFIGVSIVSNIILKKVETGKKLILGQSMFGIFLILTSFFSTGWVSAIALLISSIFLGITHATYNPILQSIVDEDNLGKVLSAKYSMGVGIMPLGSLFFGKIANILPASIFFIIFGGTYLFVALMCISDVTIRNFSLNG